MNSLGLLNAINGTEGFSTNIKLNDSDLDVLRKLIRIQWLYRLQLLDDKNVYQFDKLGIERYHELCHLIDHSSSWPKKARVLPKEAVSLIRKLDFFKLLEDELGYFQISDEEHLGWEEIYWRLVRPGNNDCGSLHADKWFWDIGGYGKVAGFPHTRLKIWIPIYTSPGKNGLLISPGSHLKKNWKWHSELRYGLNKPILDEPIENINPVLLSLEPGHAVVFHDELIHGGAPNTAETTRVSMEFTLLIPSNG
ncbi:MAG: hypothetical protein ACD_46C00180G0007 [uncultured bacterium]|nr:MAG: hypothetical protein ACD_46C00180G0007 [uncultured bacterium]